MEENTQESQSQPENSTNKRQIEGGYGKMGPDTGKTFSSEYQPSPEAKSAGRLKQLKGQQLAKAVLELAFKGVKNSELKKAAAEYFGIDEDEITVAMMLHFRQAEKAIQKADTHAYNAIINRAEGLPKQSLEHTGKDGAPIPIHATGNITHNIKFSDAANDSDKPESEEAV